MRRSATILLTVSLMFMACTSVQVQHGKKAPAEAPKITPEANAAQAGEASVNKEQAKAPKTPEKPEAKSHLVEQKLGGPGLEIIKGAERVELVYVVSEKNLNAKNHLQQHEIKSEPIALNAEAIKTLQTMILNKETHVFGARARCRFRPKYGLIFYKGEQRTTIVLATPRCAKWAFERETKRKIVDIRKPADQALADLISRVKGGGSKSPSLRGSRPPR